AHGLELALRAEVVVYAVDLARTPFARGRRDRQFELAGVVDVLLIEQMPRQRRFSRAGRRGQHQHDAAPADVDLVVHSRFCTCSRNCSTTLLSWSPILVSSTSLALAVSVFDSRLSSCARKSSLRPMGPPSWSSFCACAPCERSRSSSSRMSALVASMIA